MPPKKKRIKITETVIRLIENVNAYFKYESKKKRPKYKWSKTTDRTADALGISSAAIRRIIDGNYVHHPPKERRNVKSLDGFDKDLIIRVAYEFFSKNEVLTIKRLRDRLWRCIPS